MKGKYMKKIAAILLLFGLIASAVMAEANPSTGKSVQAAASTTASAAARKHRKHRKHRKTGIKTTSAKPGK
jgi:hypothetical protein